MLHDFRPGDLVWFDPGVGYVLPGEVIEFHKKAQVITVQAVINSVSKTFTLNNLSSVRMRQDLGHNGVDDMITISDLNEASILWNLRIRYDNNQIYTYIGSILVSVNPYRMFDSYGLDRVAKYDGQTSLPPHLFAVGAGAYGRLVTKEGENQVLLITGESGAGKTECSKLLLQYYAAKQQSTNMITEQILEAGPLLESFGNAKTVRNDNSSRFGKYTELIFRTGVVTGARITDYLLEKSRIVTHAPEERNYHVFYEMLTGLSKEEKEKYGLMLPEKYFYLNQGGSCTIDGKNDKEDFKSLMSAMMVLGFTAEERDTIFKILSSILHLGNVFFHRKQLKHGQEGVEVGSDVEIKWAAHLLQLHVGGITKALVFKMADHRSETVAAPLNIDQALDARDAIAKALYSSLFTWLVARVNKIISISKHQRKQVTKNIIAILDIFGFEDFQENSFEQLCINYANEHLQYFFNKHIFKHEQAEYAKEKIEWTPIPFNDNQPVLHILSKKPIGIFHLLDDESNFPKGSDLSFLEKCHYNHALDDLYSRPRMSSMEFGIKHFAGQVWYTVEGFLEKNRETLRYDVMSLLISSKDKLISKMFLDLRNQHEATRTMNTHSNGGQFITMKPRTATVGARFQEALQQLLSTMHHSHPSYIRCIKPNNDKCPMKFDMPVVLEQLRTTGMLETIRIRKSGYPVRMKYSTFASRYSCLLRGRIPRGAPTKELSRLILDQVRDRNSYELGSTKIFMREPLEKKLERERQEIQEVEVLKMQRYVRGYLARKRYNRMKRSALLIQSHYRGYKVRREYSKVRKGVVALQAVYRMKKQQSIYGEMKEEMIRRKELELEFRQRARELQQQQQQQQQMQQPQHRRSSEPPLEVMEAPTMTSVASSHRAVASVNHLEVPAELAFIISKLEADWKQDHLVKVNVQPPANQPKYKLPHDIDYFAFSRVASVYFKSHLWQMKREPIKTPFLSKSKEADYQESLAIFKLILRFMNDEKLSGQREKVLCDYIINKGINNEKLRDEIYCQLVNQTWKNDNEENAERGWWLLSNCLSSFPPSRTLYKYLLKHVSDNAYNGYKYVCQQKLLRASQLSRPAQGRAYPPTSLEWRANKKRVNMALDAKFHDDEVRPAPIESFMTAEEFAANALASRGVPELQGWTVSLDEGNTSAEINGGEFVLDGIGELELPAAFPTERRPNILVTADKGRGAMPLFVDTQQLLDPERSYRFSSSPPALRRGPSRDRGKRARSQDRLMDDVGLSRSTALNDRYFERTDKSRSLDNLLGGGGENFGLSESRLNQRYLSHTIGDKRAEEWDDLGLSKTPLNDRYFSQPDLDQPKLSAHRSRSSDNLKPADDVTKSKRGHGNPRVGKGRRGAGRMSSAMSDTSEAPSIASHVRRVRVPSQASDVDQFLDDLFIPVLDGQTVDDGLSDARSLAASMRGGADDDPEVFSLMSRSFPHRRSVLSIDIEHSSVNGLGLVHEVVHAIRGGKDTPPRSTSPSPTKPADGSLGFQPIPGLISPTSMGGMMSPPPMLMPTPIQAGQLTSPLPGDQPAAMAFTYVPVPVYNMGGMSLPGMQMGVPGQMGMQMGIPGQMGMPTMFPPQQTSQTPSPTKQETSMSSSGNGSQPPKGTSTPQPPSLDSYQQAFLQNAVAQNMQIQQQLMMQNQALAQLLSQSGPASMMAGQMSAQMPGQMPGQMQAKFYGQSMTPQPSAHYSAYSGASSPRKSRERTVSPETDRNYRRASADQLAMGGGEAPPTMEKPRSLTAPNTPRHSNVQQPDQAALAAMDPYTRARTVRIGKWRWPPPKEEMDGTQEGFFEFKMRKMSEKKQPRDESFDTSGEIQGIDWDDDEPDGDEKLRRSASKDSFGSEDKTSMTGSVGKLKLSSEMKEKLEAVTGGPASRKSSVRSEGEGGVKKLNENRRLLIEQKLGGGGGAEGKLKKWDTVDEVYRATIPEAPSRKVPVFDGDIPIPPPPPPAPHLKMRHQVEGPNKPLPGIPAGERDPFGKRRGSTSTHHTDKSEKFEFEESAEFLQPVDNPPVLVDEDDYQALEDIKTTIYKPHSNTHFSYGNEVPWQLKIRKEIFSPSEVVKSPLAINLIFCQIVTDVFSPLCIRMTLEERSRMKNLLDEYEIDLQNVFSSRHKLSTKMNIIEVAKEFHTYFARLYPVSSGEEENPDNQYLAVSHSGLRLIRRERGLPTDHLQVLETYSFEDIGEVSTVKSNGLQVVTYAGGRVLVQTEKAAQIKDLLSQYLIEANSGTYDYVKALVEFKSKDESALNFRKGEIIAVVPKRDAYTEKGWLYGVKDGHYGLFPSDFVERLSPQTIRREMRVIAKVTKAKTESESEEESEELAEHEDPGDTWESKRRTIDEDALSEVSASAAKVTNDGKHPLLEFAMRYFRDVEMVQSPDGSVIGGQGGQRKKKSKKTKNNKDWTWRDQINTVKWSDQMINNSLLRLEPAEMNKIALECFASILRYMGDLELIKNQHEVDCVNLILMYCHKFDTIRDEVYCQIMKQTTNNKSNHRDSCQKGWRLFSMIAAYFTCSDLLKPYLYKYLETAAYDKRRAYHGTALVCLHNLRKTFKYGGRKNVPSIEEITAISAGRNSKRQIYRLPGGTERVINTKSTTVVDDIIEELCNIIDVQEENEREEFSLYCIVEGETFTVPLAKEHYILDVTTELQRDGAIYYLIFCRSVWHYSLRLDNQLYIEVVFNQIAPDYLEGLLLVMPGQQIEQSVVYDIAKVAALLHKAADMEHKPTIKETKFLLPKPALSARDIKPPQWVNLVQSSWDDIQHHSPSRAKAQVLEILSGWPLFGSSFFAVRRESDAKGGSEHILALNKHGVSFLDLITHETLLHYPFTEVISTRKVQTEDGTLFLDMKCGNLMQQRISRIQTEQANEIARLIRSYITIDQRMRGVNVKEDSPDR